MRRVLRPSDLLTLFFLVLLSCLAVFSAPVNPSWTGLFATYTTLAVAILAAAVYRTRVDPAKKGFYLSVVATVVTVLFMFNSLGALIASIHTTMIDACLNFMLQNRVPPSNRPTTKLRGRRQCRGQGWSKGKHVS